MTAEGCDWLRCHMTDERDISSAGTERVSKVNLFCIFILTPPQPAGRFFVFFLIDCTTPLMCIIFYLFMLCDKKNIVLGHMPKGPLHCKESVGVSPSRIGIQGAPWAQWSCDCQVHQCATVVYMHPHTCSLQIGLEMHNI